jgi:hypothetical protein
MQPKLPELKQFGVAVDEVGFFMMDDLQPLGGVRKENMAYIMAEDPRATPQIIEDGLKKLVCDSWDWQVEQISETDFAFIFPKQDSLHLCRNVVDLSLPISKIRVCVLIEIPQPLGDSLKLTEI